MVVPHTYIKDQVYYFQRKVPKDLIQHYSKHKIAICLKTRSARQAATAAKSIAYKLDNYWLSLRIQDIQVPAAHLLVDSRVITASDQPTIEDALDIYLRLKGLDRNKGFHSTAKRNIGYAVDCLGCLPIDQYSTTDAGKFRDWLTGRGLSGSSIKRVFNSVKAIVNLTIQEHGIDIRNVFSGVYLPTNSSSTKRHPISNADLKKIQNECVRIDDDLRWLVALISDTGMRLSEATGLHVDDLVLDGSIPHITIQPHPWRTLKTSSSKRVVPLVGMSLWAAQQVKRNHPTGFCFPRYTSSDSCNANSASAALNKWIKTVGQDTDVLHGFRHGFRDRLRAAEIQTDLIDQLGGWSLQTIGQGYGDGYPLANCHAAMLKGIGSD